MSFNGKPSSWSELEQPDHIAMLAEGPRSWFAVRIGIGPVGRPQALGAGFDAPPAGDLVG
jgi:hypothetical protein